MNEKYAKSGITVTEEDMGSAYRIAVRGMNDVLNSVYHTLSRCGDPRAVVLVRDNPIDPSTGYLEQGWSLSAPFDVRKMLKGFAGDVAVALELVREGKAVPYWSCDSKTSVEAFTRRAGAFLECSLAFSKEAAAVARRKYEELSSFVPKCKISEVEASGYDSPLFITTTTFRSPEEWDAYNAAFGDTLPSTPAASAFNERFREQLSEGSPTEKEFWYGANQIARFATLSNKNHGVISFDELDEWKLAPMVLGDALSEKEKDEIWAAAERYAELSGCVVAGEVGYAIRDGRPVLACCLEDSATREGFLLYGTASPELVLYNESGEDVVAAYASAMGLSEEENLDLRESVYGTEEEEREK